MDEQISLFDSDNCKDEEDISELGNYALVFLVTKSGGNRGNLFVLPIEDAQKLCSDESSHGISRGGHWMFQWTSILHFVHQNDTYDGRLEDFVFIKDSGRQDKDFARLGIRKPTISEQCDILRKLGYVMKMK